MPEPTRLFLDTEFTGLNQQARLISLALCAETGPAFYAELAGLDLTGLDPWVRDHVIPRTRWLSQPAPVRTWVREAGLTVGHDEAPAVARALAKWLARWRRVEVWADCLAYDWVLFCELFGGARALPPQVFYMPFDLVTLFKLRGLDPDTDRAVFAGFPADYPRHDALVDARISQACYRRLMGPPWVSDAHAQKAGPPGRAARTGPPGTPAARR